MRVNNHERSNRSRGLVASSAASYRFAAALQAFLNCGFWSSFCSRFFSLDILCQTEIETNGAHSFLMIPLSSDWKALIMKESRCVRIVRESVVSKIIERIRRNRLENSAGLSANISINVSRGFPNFKLKHKKLTPCWKVFASPDIAHQYNEKNMKIGRIFSVSWPKIAL
jgi:hypothetical protein